MRQEFFGDARPASTLVEVSALAVPGALLEIEAVAAISELSLLVRNSRSAPVRRELERPRVGGPRLVVAAEPAEQVGPGGVEVAVVLEAGDRVDRGEAVLRAVGHGDCDRAVQLDDRRGLQRAAARRRAATICGQSLVSPVWQAAIAAWSWYGPGRPRRQRGLDERTALGDLVLVPARAVLVLQQDELPVAVEPSVAARVLEQHQREQAEHLRVVRHQGDEHPAEPDRLRARARCARSSTPR